MSDWTDAACAGHLRPEWWFPSQGQKSRGNHEAIRICRTCPLQVECAQYACDNELHGIWGGLTDEERRRDRPRQARPQELSPCGTYAAYVRHQRHGETPCHACRAANQRKGQERREARRKVQQG